MRAKLLKIGASGGAAQAAEAKGDKSLIFTLVHHFDSHFGNSTLDQSSNLVRPSHEALLDYWI